MKIIQWASIGLILSGTFTGCTSLYVPGSHNVPMFSGKNEFQGSAGSASDLSGLNIHTAYSITDHVGVTANYLYADNSSFDTDEQHGRIHQAGEVGIGYYTNFNERWCIELFAGAGLGKGSEFDSSYYLFPLFSDDLYQARGSYYKIYFQPSVGRKEGPLIGNFSLKFSYVDFTNSQVTLNGEPVLSKKRAKLFIEPVGTCLIPLWKKKIFASFQFGFNFHVGKEPFYHYDYFTCSIGLIARLKPE